MTATVRSGGERVLGAAGVPPSSGRRTGTVVEFDPATGLGSIDSGGTPFPFHCIEIADDTRSIAVGTVVHFDVLAKFGRYEAAAISS